MQTENKQHFNLGLVPYDVVWNQEMVREVHGMNKTETPLNSRTDDEDEKQHLFQILFIHVYNTWNEPNIHHTKIHQNQCLESNPRIE